MKNKLKISIQNNLTINNAAEIYKLLAEGLQSDSDLVVSLPNSLPVDVTFMQTLHAFKAKCKSIDKKVFFDINGQNDFVKTIINMGYYDVSKTLEIPENMAGDN